ncbi:hypothetical protein NP493_907g00000 [Ridgeia piscesae]|uniref:G-protein coupled receptors family 1 profile domain-containing protein n=1 Tax=Ridgeia piscesae TaxID=27915 RepID=A0AAD9KL09_RIDPI|nr:hypothetical protein NP493_907g00000 [Ridgeia piscesae]
MCKLYYFVQSVSYTASVIILTVISMERYLAIIHPMLSKRLTSTCLHGAVVVIVWFIAVIYSLPIPVAYDVFSLSSPDDPSTSVHFCYQMRKLNMKAYVTVNFVLWYVVPLVLMVVMYTSISIVLWRTSSGRPASERFLRRPDTFRLTPTTPTTTGAKDTCVTNTTDLDRCYINQHVGFSSSPRGTPSVSPVINSWRKFSTTPAVARPTRLPVPSLAYDPSRAGYGDRLKVSSPLRNGLGRDPFDGRRQSAGSRSPSSPVCTRSLSSPGQRARSPSSPGDALPRTPGQRKSSTELMLRTQTKRRNPLVARRKVIRLLIAIIVSFAACVLPHHVRLLWQTWTTRRHYTHENLLVPPVTFLLFYFNSCLNPFLYAFLSDNFRQSLAQLLSCRRLCRLKGR